MSDDGFDDAFASLFAIAYRVAYRSLGSAAEAEEVAQESMTRALLRWGRIRDRAPGWVAVVSLRLSIDATRRRTRPSYFDDLEAPAVGPEIERRLDLTTALLRLPKRQRQVLACRYLADLPDDETAQLLGISSGSVKQHASRGLASLRGTDLALEGPCNA
jgi:RNA polymerase sigma factor (sigma-70 family)